MQFHFVRTLLIRKILVGVLASLALPVFAKVTTNHPATTSLNSAPQFINVLAFNDVPPNDWAEPMITFLKARDLVSGVSKTEFNPDGAMTRAQFASLLKRAFPQATADRPAVSFADVKAKGAKYWAAEPIQWAYTRKFMSGVSAKQFKPDDVVTREQVAVALFSGLQMSLPDDGTTIAVLTNTYEDSDRISSWARQGVAGATESVIVVSTQKFSGNKFFFKPSTPATRREVAAMLYQMQVFLSKAPVLPMMQATRYIVGYKPDPRFNCMFQLNLADWDEVFWLKTDTGREASVCRNRQDKSQYLYAEKDASGTEDRADAMITGNDDYTTTPLGTQGYEVTTNVSNNEWMGKKPDGSVLTEKIVDLKRW